MDEDRDIRPRRLVDTVDQPSRMDDDVVREGGTRGQQEDERGAAQQRSFHG
jgi:hypothetical protein